LGLRYARSVTDNRRNGDELVLFSDGNPHAEDVAVAYEVDQAYEGKEPFKHHKPIYPANHDSSMDWTGPAQELADGQERKHPTKPGRVTIAGHPKDDIAPGTLNSILRQAGLKD
jgi:hypothetical protein